MLGKKTTKKGQAKMLEIIGVTATVAGAVIALVHLVYDIVKDDKKQNCDRHNSTR